MRFEVGGRTANTAATANHVAAQLWNPDSTKPIYVREIHWAQLNATISNVALQRSSARGATPTSTVTPDADNAYNAQTAPPSASVLELSTFGTQPTLATPPIRRTNLPAAIGSGFIWVFEPPLEIRPATGLCIATPVAVILQAADVTFIWDE